MIPVHDALAVTWRESPPAALERAEHLLADARPTRRSEGAHSRSLWVPLDPAGSDEDAGDDRVLALQQESRGPHGGLGPQALAALLDELVPPAPVQPPCGVLGTDHVHGTVTAMTDQLGFRHVYHASGPGWSAVSTSSRALAVLTGRGLDLTTWELQSLLGWPAGSGSAFAGVQKVMAGGRVRLTRGGIQTTADPPDDAPSYAGTLDDAVRTAARLVRRGVEQALDDHPDLLLQLTGGLDSRILLAAVPPERRHGLSCLTLVVPGSPDAALAADLTARFGMRHHVLDLDAVGELQPDQARALAEDAARRLDSATDPLALAVLRVVEGPLATRPRLSGLGGEVVRGFYYLPPPLRGLGRDDRVARLARWRMFPNEEVPDEVVHPRLRHGRRTRAVAELQAVFESYPTGWNTATDHFYLDQRMQRWAGVLASASSAERVVVNPMLDPEFLALGASLPPRWKARARFLSRILGELDPALAELPLDGRPAPRAYADPGWRDRLTFAGLLGRKVVGKVGQRLTASGRAPAGGVTLADLVLESWRAAPGLLEGVRGLEVVDPAWLDQVLAGAAAPPSAVALLTNLVVAAETLEPCGRQVAVSAGARPSPLPAPPAAGPV